jgi:hypothetical protein
MMKSAFTFLPLSALVLLVLVWPLRLEADEALKNGDFSDGINHWSGDGEDVAQAAPDLAPKGMIIKLDPNEWTKAVQEFIPIGTDFTCAITYKLSPDAQFSVDEKDYRNVPKHLGYALWKRFRIPKGDWMMMISDFGEKISGTYFPIKPGPTPGETETFQTTIGGLETREDKTITLAFPPGQGSVIILNVSMTTSTTGT